MKIKFFKKPSNITGEMIHVISQDAGISCLVASKLKGKQDNVILFGDREGKLSYLDLETLQVRKGNINFAQSS